MKRVFISAVLFSFFLVHFLNDLTYDQSGFPVRAEVERQEIKKYKKSADTRLIFLMYWNPEGGKAYAVREVDVLDDVKVGDVLSGTCSIEKAGDCRFDHFDPEFGSPHLVVTSLVLLILAVMLVWRNARWTWNQSLVKGSWGKTLRLKRSLIQAVHNGLICAVLIAIARTYFGRFSVTLTDHLWVLALAFVLALPMVFYVVTYVVRTPYLEFSEEGFKLFEGISRPISWSWSQIGGVALAEGSNVAPGGRVKVAPGREATLLVVWRGDTNNPERIATSMGYHSRRSTMVAIPLEQFGPIQAVTDGLRMFLVANGKAAFLNQEIPVTRR